VISWRADQQREYRARNRDAYFANRSRVLARATAARNVAKRHRAEWDREYVAERERRGVDPWPKMGRPRE
jgi:hypothetical protein